MGRGGFSKGRCATGVSVTNTFLVPHFQSTGLQGISFRVHQQNVGVDTTSPEIGVNDWQALKGATSSQGAFDIAAGNTALGGWYAGRTAGEHAQMRTWTAALATGI